MTSKTLDGWEIVIGLEVHAELATATKLFSSAQNVFGGEPNTNIDPVSLGISLKNQENLKGKDALYNSKRIIEIFEGKVDEFSEAVSLNAAAGLVISNKSQDFKNAFDNVRKHLKSGQVKNFLEKIRS